MLCYWFQCSLRRSPYKVQMTRLYLTNSIHPFLCAIIHIFMGIFSCFPFFFLWVFIYIYQLIDTFNIIFAKATVLYTYIHSFCLSLIISVVHLFLFLSLSNVNCFILDTKQLLFFGLFIMKGGNSVITLSRVLSLV